VLHAKAKAVSADRARSRSLFYPDGLLSHAAITYFPYATDELFISSRDPWEMWMDA
jgi:hypothetical protein